VLFFFFRSTFKASVSKHCSHQRLRCCCPGSVYLSSGCVRCRCWRTPLFSCLCVFMNLIVLNNYCSKGVNGFVHSFNSVCKVGNWELHKNSCNALLQVCASLQLKNTYRFQSPTVQLLLKFLHLHPTRYLIFGSKPLFFSTCK